MQDIPLEVLKRAAQGDLRSFEELYRATSGFVFNVALRVTGNREDAQDVTQEVYVIVYRELKNFRFESSLKTWMYRVTVNDAINFAKRNSRHRQRTVEYDEAVTAATVESDVKETIKREALEHQVQTLLAAVNPEQRACVVLRNIEGFSYEQIAETLKINLNTVRSRLKRAREKMLALGKQVLE